MMYYAQETAGETSELLIDYRFHLFIVVFLMGPLTSFHE